MKKKTVPVHQWVFNAVKRSGDRRRVYTIMYTSSANWMPQYTPNLHKNQNYKKKQAMTK